MRQKGGKSTKVEKHGFFPHNQGLTSPTPYPLEPCPFHLMLHCYSWLWFIWIDVRVYMMSNYKVPDSTTNHRQISPLLNILNQIDGGGFALSSSPGLITIYTSCKRGRNRGHYIRICNLLLPFLCEFFSSLSLPFCFLSYLNVVYNSLEFILAMLQLLF